MGKGNHVKKMPALFIGHGSPQNAIADNAFTRAIAAWGKDLPRPKAICVVSAHWLTYGTSVCCVDHPSTIHDFYGFPEELYAIKYPAPGAPKIAKETASLIKAAPVTCRNDWGLDHGAWTILRHMFPAADIPVFQLSIDYSYQEWQPKPLSDYFHIGSELSALREKGVLLIGSGNLVHNLREIIFDEEAEPFPWAIEFDQAVKESLLTRNYKKLLNLQELVNNPTRAHPTLDHYLPLLYVIATQSPEESITFPFEGIAYGSISMRCVQIN